jgi:multiple sugar transport system permease protein
MKKWLTLTPEQKAKWHRFLVGKTFTDGFLYRLVIYVLLISFSYIYLYPLLFMLVNSLKTVDDLINPGVNWIPTSINWTNYTRAFQVLNLPDALWSSSWYVLRVSVAVTISSALIGYGFARFEFPFKKIFFAFMLATFILPSQVTLIANLLIFRNLNL